ncbi:MAG: SDR family oxidoreductase [Dehalococcoidia bacterium]|nr:SDR family oxidoreductase [Dehalococcoidia bacterium]
MGERLKGRAAVVTGAGRGIGRAVALALAAEGASVVVNDLGAAVDGSGESTGPADNVVDEIRTAGGSAVASFDSVATPEGGQAIIRTALDNYGRVDILVNVAGILRDRALLNMTEEEWDAVIAVHLKGHYCTCKPAASQMRRQRFGRIINFSSASGFIGAHGQANFAAAKSGIVGLTRVLARELGRHGITCNAIAPVAETRLTAPISEAARQMGETPPKLGDPMQVAMMVCYLATEDAWNVNGKLFYVSGGAISLAYDEDMGRTLTKDGMWTVEELAGLLPGRLLQGVPNPAPPPELEIPGRPTGTA